MEYDKIIKELQSEHDSMHFQNMINILRFDEFWNDEEMAYCIRMYDQIAMQKREWNQLGTKQRLMFEKMIKAIGWR